MHYMSAVKVPESALAAVEHIEDGETGLHRYPGEDARQEIWTRIVMWAKEHHKKRVPMTELVTELNEEFPDLEVTHTQLRYAIDHYVVPALVKMMPGIVGRGLIEAGVDLDTTTAKLRQADKMRQLMEEMENVPECVRDMSSKYACGAHDECWTRVKKPDGEEVTIPMSGHPKWTENYTRLQKNWLTLVESGEDGMERFGLIQPRKTHLDIERREKPTPDVDKTLERMGLGGEPKTMRKGDDGVYTADD